jgi:HEPN domain-containing protein
MQVGVYHQKAIIDFSGLHDYLKELLDEFESQRKKNKKGIRPKALFERVHTNLSEALEQLNETGHRDEEFLKQLTKTLGTFAMLDNFPREMKDLFFKKVERKLPGGRTFESRRRRFENPLIFDSGIDRTAKDVFLAEKRHISGEKWLVDVTTIKKSGIASFKKRVCCLPPIKETMKVLRDKQQFSTRYAFRPYALATQLWLTDNESVAIHNDLKSFLSGAVRYIFSGEWRTSIVLSAIAVESGLADLYEEEHKKPAPDTPLGDLFRQVKDRVDFPNEIAAAINMANEARIAAVHRSRFPVSDREATNALYGAVNFILWFSS